MTRLGRGALAIGVLATGTLVGSPGQVGAAPNDGAATVFISEIHYDNTGTDSGEAIEVFGPAGTDLTGWSVVLYNGANGAVYDTDPLPTPIPDLGGGFGVVVLNYPSNGIQNGAPDGVALVNGTDVVQFLSYEGTFTAVGGPADTLLSVDIGVAESGGGPIGNSLKLAGAGSCPAALAWTAESANTFGAIAPIDPSGGCDVVPPPPPPPVIVPIHAVQGSGAATPLSGQTVTIEGIVVGDHEGSSPALRGFFVQEEDADADADPLTSEGVFVFNGNLDSVALGDRVRVTGTAGEFNGNTQLTATAVEVLAVAQPLPSPATVEFPVASVDALEAFEGMAATMPQTLVVSEYFNYDRFGEVVVALPAPGETRPFTPTALFAPDDPQAAARADLNARSRITIDDGLTSQNPATVIHPITRDEVTLANSFRGGDTVAGLTGPVWFAFGLYRVLPYPEGAGYATYTQTVAPAVPDPVGGSLRVASFNTLNYFLSIDTADTCGPTQDQDCRGADTVAEFDRQRVKLLNAIEGIDADVLGLIELENTPGVEPLADIVAGLNERLGAGTYDYVRAGTDSVVGTDAIKVGIIYRPAAVAPLGAAAVLDTPAFLDPNNTGEDRNRAAVAQTFVENGSGEVVSVVVNHWKSKGSSCGEAGESQLVGSCDVTRTLTAQVLLDWIATSPTGVTDPDWMIVGDLNSYDHENPIAVLEAAGYVDLAEAFGGEFAYSYGFDGQFGYLDYALASPSLAPQVTGATEWHINSDEADLFDYDTSFKSAAQQALFDPTTPFRSSDHDPVIVGVDLAGVDATVNVLPRRLWPVNRALRPVLVFANDGARIVPSRIVSVTSSEPDSGLDRRDRPNDIVLVGNNLVLLRAEEYTSAGRTYTIAVETVDAGQVRFDQVTVTVGFG